jgi:hypothetical protein
MFQTGRIRLQIISPKYKHISYLCQWHWIKSKPATSLLCNCVFCYTTGKAIGLPEEFLAFAEGSKGGGVIQVSKNNQLNGSQFMLQNVHIDALTGFCDCSTIIQVRFGDMGNGSGQDFLKSLHPHTLPRNPSPPPSPHKTEMLISVLKRATR